MPLLWIGQLNLVSTVASLSSILGLLECWARCSLVSLDCCTNREALPHFRKLEKTIDGSLVEKRFFKSPGGDYDPLLLPPEWSQWLHKTRAEVPSPEDIARSACV